MQAIKRKEKYRKVPGEPIEKVRYVGIDGILYTVNIGERVKCLPKTVLSVVSRPW